VLVEDGRRVEAGGVGDVGDGRAVVGEEALREADFLLDEKGGRGRVEVEAEQLEEAGGAVAGALDEGADPAAVAFKAVERALQEHHDVVIVDTAGRLQTRKPLMEQLGKMRRVLDKAAPGAPHETLLVLDATTGQNAIAQARTFGAALPITGIVVCKLDGTARGGVVVAVRRELGVPVKFVGLGEGPDDLAPFDAGAFAEGLLR